MNVQQITAADIRNMPEYAIIRPSAKEYDRVFTAVENDKKFQEFAAAKLALKVFCITAYQQAGKTPADLYTTLFGQTDGTNLSKNNGRVFNKINNYEKSEMPTNAKVSFKVEEITPAKLKELSTSLIGFYEEFEAEKPYATASGVTHADFRAAKKGENGLVKVLKKSRDKLADDSYVAALKQALIQDGVKNDKTIGKIDGAAEKAKAAKEAAQTK